MGAGYGLDMGVLEKSAVSDEALREFEQDARRRSHTVATEPARNGSRPL